MVAPIGISAAHHDCEPPVRLLVGQRRTFSQRNRKRLDISDVHTLTFGFCKGGERDPLLRSEVRIHGVAHLLQQRGHAIAGSFNARQPGSCSPLLVSDRANPLPGKLLFNDVDL